MILLTTIILLLTNCMLFPVFASDFDYPTLIFDDTFVHTVNILIDEDDFNYITTYATDEKYAECTAVIDGETIEKVGIRPMGNSSLSSIKSSGSDNFSFKIKFDCYEDGKNYHGLDKLALNNLGSDPTCMKNYLSYHMMNDMDVPAPLCSYAILQINGVDHNLALATECIDHSFAERNFGENHGELYKPDVFTIESIKPSSFMKGDMKTVLENNEAFRKDILGSIINVAFLDSKDKVDISAMNYAGEEIADYNVIFDKSVFNVSKKDKKHLLKAIRNLNSDTCPEADGTFEDALYFEYVLPYFAVHNFVNNYDGYTGFFVHNFYLYENDSRLAMIPWDYNLAFGAFSVESAVNNFFGDTKYDVSLDTKSVLSSDESFVNYPIDTPTYSVDYKDRPMFGAWIDNEDYRKQYHSYMSDFLEKYFENGQYDTECQKVRSLIRPYIKSGLTFYSEEAFDEACHNLDKYCNLRYLSIKGQLDGSIPATCDGQEKSPETLIKTGDLDLSKTIDFNGLAFGITSTDMDNLMDAIAGDKPHNSEGVSAKLEELKEHPLSDPGIVTRVIVSFPPLRDAFLEYMDFAIFTVSAIVIGIILIVVLAKRNKT